MPRIELSHWHDGRSPGDVVEVDDDQLAAMRRDGRVARVVEEPAAVEASAAPSAVSSQPAGDGRLRKGR